MENYWTSKKPIKGLRHFVVVNKQKKKGQISFLMVSVIDAEINLIITYEELANSSQWAKGWIDLPKIESITKDYYEYKSSNKENHHIKIYVSDDSLFNIS